MGQSILSLLHLCFVEYAQVLRMLGQGRLEAQCMDGVKRLCHIRGKMRKKVWVNVGDIVLLGLREYQVCISPLKIVERISRQPKVWHAVPVGHSTCDAALYVDCHTRSTAMCASMSMVSSAYPYPFSAFNCLFQSLQSVG
jgi:initiation factor 1A